MRTHHLLIAAAAYLLIAAAACLHWPVFDVAAAVMLAVPFVLALGIVFIIIRRISKKLGGITGDVIGFGVEMAQWIYLASACIAFRLI